MRLNVAATVTGLDPSQVGIMVGGPTDRVFSVQKPRRKDGFENVVAEECILHDGALVFRSGGFLVRAIAPGHWAGVEEGDPEDLT